MADTSDGPKKEIMLVDLGNGVPIHAWVTVLPDDDDDDAGSDDGSSDQPAS